MGQPLQGIGSALVRNISNENEDSIEAASSSIVGPIAEISTAIFRKPYVAHSSNLCLTSYRWEAATSILNTPGRVTSEALKQADDIETFTEIITSALENGEIVPALRLMSEKEVEAFGAKLATIYTPESVFSFCMDNFNDLESDSGLIRSIARRCISTTDPALKHSGEALEGDLDLPNRFNQEHVMSRIELFINLIDERQDDLDGWQMTEGLFGLLEGSDDCFSKVWSNGQVSQSHYHLQEVIIPMAQRVVGKCTACINALDEDTKYWIEVGIIDEKSHSSVSLTFALLAIVMEEDPDERAAMIVELRSKVPSQYISIFDACLGISKVKKRESRLAAIDAMSTEQFVNWCLSLKPHEQRKLQEYMVNVKNWSRYPRLKEKVHALELAYSVQNRPVPQLASRNISRVVKQSIL